jgi:hypothetical protein
MNQAVSVNTPRPHLWRYDRSNALFKIPARKVRDSWTNGLIFLNQIVILAGQGRRVRIGVRKEKYMYEIGPEFEKKSEESREKAGLRNIYYV